MPLLHLVWAVTAFRPKQAQHAFETLASFTSSRKGALTQAATEELERSFARIWPGFEHLLRPEIRRVLLDGAARRYLDTPYLVEGVLKLQRLAAPDPFGTAAVASFLDLLGVPRRRTL